MALHGHFGPNYPDIRSGIASLVCLIAYEVWSSWMSLKVLEPIHKVWDTSGAIYDCGLSWIRSPKSSEGSRHNDLNGSPTFHDTLPSGWMIEEPNTK